MGVLKLMFALAATLLALAFRPDDPPSGDDDDGKPSGDDDDGKPTDATDKGGKAGDDDGNYYRVIRLRSEEDEEKFFDRAFKKRHRRMKEDARKEVEDDLRDEIAAEYEKDVDAAKRQAENRKTKIANLEAQLDEKDQEIERLEGAISDEQKNTQRYAGVIEKRWEKIAPRVPEHITELIGDRDVLDRLDYIERHPNVLTDETSTDDDTPTDDQQQRQQQPPTDDTQQHRVIGSPPTPQHQRRTESPQDEADREALETTNRQIQHAL